MENKRLNEKCIDLMDKLADIMAKRGEPFRARAYQKAQETIVSFPHDILKPDDLKGKSGIGTTIMENLNEYFQTGTLKLIEKEKNNPVNILSDVYGIGPKKSKELVEQGITTIGLLRENQHLLNDVQKIGLQYYEDVLKRIPRSEIEDYKVAFEKAFDKVTTTLETGKMEIVGSYRRGAENSGDIDVIITSTSPKVFTSFIEILIKENIVIHVLSRGPSKCLVMAKIPSSDTVRRVDFLYTSPNEFPFAILYFTGSKIFNTAMRHIALEKGFTMNEHGLYKKNNFVGEKEEKREKIDKIFTTEEDIFHFLGLIYKSPQERTDGRAISFINKSDIISSDNAVNNNKISKVSKTLKKRTIKKKPLPFIIEEDDSDEIISFVVHFKKDGLIFLDKLTETQLSTFLLESNKAYYNSTNNTPSVMLSDTEYDILKEYIQKKYPNNKAVTEIGAPININININSASRKVALPYHMGSMDKIKPDSNALANWAAKFAGPYVLSCKLDGVSGLYTTEGPVPKLYTRGDGTFGQDISHLIPYLRLPVSKGLVIRGEFILPKSTFETKYKAKFANPRNMVAGIINQKCANEEVMIDLHFVAYEMIKPVLKPWQQMDLLKTLNTENVLSKYESLLSNQLLTETLLEWRTNYEYEIDGVIVTNDLVYERGGGNPSHSFAFKMVLTEQIAEAKVVDVIWTPSKDGYLKPRVQIEPVNLGGVCIEYATGFNGSFIQDNKIGLGAVVELIRSGDVIPHIRRVSIPAEQAKMPSVPYKWNETNVDVLLEDLESDETVKEKLITGFFRGIGVEGLSSGNVSRIIKAGYDNVIKIIQMKVDDFLKVDGFKEKMATKLCNGIREKLEKANIVTLMSASNIFGRGFSEKKLELIVHSYPDVLVSKESNPQKIAKIAAIKGMATKTSEAFVEKITEFVKFIQEAGIDKILTTTPGIKNSVCSDSPLSGKSVVLTGFRDVDIQEKIKNLGGKLGTSVSKNTFIVLVKDKEEVTAKVEDAKKLGVCIMDVDEFKDKYIINI